MARYSRAGVEFILVNYWQLKMGQLPMSVMAKTGNKLRSPQETCAVWIGDIDQALDRMSRKPGRWLQVSPVITERRLLSIINEFSRGQQIIMRAYLLSPDEHEPALESIARVKMAYRAVQWLRRLMNGDDDGKLNQTKA